MIKHLNALIFLCAFALVCCASGLLYFFIRGSFTYAIVAMVALILFFALMVVLLKDRRVARIMKEDNYDKEHEVF